MSTKNLMNSFFKELFHHQFKINKRVFDLKLTCSLHLIFDKCMIIFIIIIQGFMF